MYNHCIIHITLVLVPKFDVNSIITYNILVFISAYCAKYKNLSFITETHRISHNI